jgi:hypothetical protein
MVKVGFDSGGGEFPDPIRVNLGHEMRYEGTIAEISDVQVVEDRFSDEDDATKEQYRIAFRTSFDDLEDDLDEDTLETLREEVQSAREERVDEFGEDKVSYPEEGVELVMFPTAIVTPPVPPHGTPSKLFETLRKVGIADVDDQDEVVFYNRDGDEVDPFADLSDPSDEDLNAAFTQYLRNNLTGMKVKYEVSNTKRGTDDEYSAVGKVIGKVADPLAD